MKKIVISSSLVSILFVLSSIAYGLVEDDCYFDGIYTNLSAGGALRIPSGNANTRVHVTSFAELNYNVPLTFAIRQNSPFVALSAGQGFQFSQDLFGGWEGYISYSKYKRKTPIFSKRFTRIPDGATGGEITFSDTIGTRLNALEFGIDLRPGILLCTNTLLYGKIGAGYNRMTVTSEPAFTFIQTLFSARVSLGHSQKKNHIVWRAGLGLERKFANCFSMRLDYTFSYYGKLIISRSNYAIQPEGITDTIMSPTDTVEVKFLGNTVAFGISYWW